MFSVGTLLIYKAHWKKKRSYWIMVPSTMSASMFSNKMPEMTLQFLVFIWFWKGSVRTISAINWATGRVAKAKQTNSRALLLYRNCHLDPMLTILSTMEPWRGLKTELLIKPCLQNKSYPGQFAQDGRWPSCNFNILLPSNLATRSSM
jgi:hypothetical protein